MEADLETRMAKAKRWISIARDMTAYLLFDKATIPFRNRFPKLLKRKFKWLNCREYTNDSEAILDCKPCQKYTDPKMFRHVCRHYGESHQECQFYFESRCF